MGSRRGPAEAVFCTIYALDLNRSFRRVPGSSSCELYFSVFKLHATSVCACLIIDIHAHFVGVLRSRACLSPPIFLNIYFRCYYRLDPRFSILDSRALAEWVGHTTGRYTSAFCSRQLSSCVPEIYSGLLLRPISSDGYCDYEDTRVCLLQGS